MSYKLQATFSGGEIDPALRERVTLNKYRNGLATARNVVVSKTGRTISRPGRKHLISATTTSGRRVRVHGTYDGKWLEFGYQYVKAYDTDGSLLGTGAHTIDDADFDNLQFLNVDSNNIAFSAERGTLVYGAGAPIFVEEDATVQTFSNWITPTVPPSVATEVNGGTGYAVQYAMSYVLDGVESVATFGAAGTFSMPLNDNETNTFNIDIAKTSVAIPNGGIDEFRIYRLPAAGGVPGFIGSTSSYVTSGANWRAAFSDVGSDADYLTQPKLAFGLGVSPFTMGLYQTRLMLANGPTANNTLITSRTGKPWSLDPGDIPLKADSPLDMAIGTNDALGLRMIDNEGLNIFTTDGLYIHDGALTPTNLGFDKRGPWIIDYRVSPLVIPGGVIFIEANTNAVKQIRYSDSKAGYLADEVSIFSDHLFRGNRVTSWAFQEGDLPLLWVTFSDGTYASFTYDDTQEMRAWTRHDSGNDIEFVASVKGFVDASSSFAVTPAKILFVTKTGVNRFIEEGIERFLTAEELELNPEADKQNKIAAMDAMVSWSSLLNDDLIDDDITLTPLSAGVWDGLLTLSVVDDAIFPDPGAGAVGTILRFFDPVDRSSVDLEVTARASDDSITVQPSSTFPSASATNPRLYNTAAVFTGLDHLDGENVSVIVDGYVISSPNNDLENYPTSTPASGSLTLPNGILGAIVHIGRPYTMDIETLDVNTIEQRPTYIESITIDKLYIKTFEARGLYVNGRFPVTDKIVGSVADQTQGRSMKPIISNAIDYENTNPITGNRYDQPTSFRHELTIPGHWDSNGRVCIRQVDPLHFEILSIIPDIDDQRR